MPTLKISGNGARALRALERKLSSLPGARLDVAKAMSEEALGLVKDGFREETDPYGRAWAKKKVDDGRKVLSGPTARLKQFHAKDVTEAEFKIVPIVDYGKWHQMKPRQKGRKRRMMVPDKGKGLPRKWSSQMVEAAIDALRARIE